MTYWMHLHEKCAARKVAGVTAWSGVPGLAQSREPLDWAGLAPFFPTQQEGHLLIA